MLTWGHYVSEAPRPMSSPFPSIVRPRLIEAVAGSFAALAILAACGSDSDSERLFFTSDRDGDLEVYSVTVKGEDEINLTDSPDDEFAPIVSPDGRLIAFRAGSEPDVSIHTMRTDGTSRTQVTTGTGIHGSQRWSPESDRLAYVVQGSDGRGVYTSAADGSGSVLLTSVRGDEVGDWSRNGNTVVFSVLNGAAPGIYTRNPDGVNQFRLTETSDYSPVWSPDSKRIAFLSRRDGNAELYVMDGDGSNQRNVTQSDADESHISWSPDGKRLLFVSERDGNPEIYVVDADGKDLTRLTTNDVVDNQPAWSPNGRRIAFVSYLDGDAEIFVMDADGANQTRITNNDAEDTSPSW